MSQEPYTLPKRSESKYRIGKVKSLPTVQVDESTGETYIELRARPEEKIYGCTKFQGHYKEEEKLGQGTFGEVYKGIHLETQRKVAMKRIIVAQEKDLFPITAQREITILKRLNHKNIIKLLEMVYDYPPESTNKDHSQITVTRNNGSQPSLNKYFYMILPYMVADLSGVLHNPRITLQMPDIKNMMKQILEGVNFIHCSKFMHRDIKTANLLIDHMGIIKLADFGLARQYYGCPPNLKFPGGAGTGAKYTSVVVTRWYRAPELVLGDKYYTTAVDIWGVGCVFAEFFEKKPILQGKTDIDQGHVIFKLMGTPDEKQWKLARYLPGAELTKTDYKPTIDERFGKYLTPTGLNFLKGLLALDPYKRFTAISALNHPFFKEEPLPTEKLVLPCEESHEADIKRYKEEMHQAMSQKAPTAPQGHVNEDEASPAKFDNKKRDISGMDAKTQNDLMSNNKRQKIRDRVNNNTNINKTSRYNPTSHLPTGPKTGSRYNDQRQGNLKRNRLVISTNSDLNRNLSSHQQPFPHQGNDSRIGRDFERQTSRYNNQRNELQSSEKIEEDKVTKTTLNRYRNKTHHNNDWNQRSRLQGHGSLPNKPVTQLNSKDATNGNYRNNDWNQNNNKDKPIDRGSVIKTDTKNNSELDSSNKQGNSKDIADLY